MPTETINIKNRWNGEVIFSTAISVTPDMTPAIKLGMAVKIALHECANLADANLVGANLADANLARANLAGAYLADAYLADAYLARAKNIKLPAFQIPQEGELIVYKKLHNGAVCKLRIPPESRRTASVVGRKCRAEFAEVIEGEGKSWRTDGDHVIDYAPGTVVNADKYDDNPLVECAGGIHFFLTREEAEVW